jgi:TonB family protein
MPEGRRTLAYGVAASLLLHALVLSLGVTTYSDPMGQAAGAPLVARIVEHYTEREPPVAEKAVAEKPRPKAAAPAEIPQAVASPEASTIGQYRYQLAAAAARHNAYPPEALINGWEGEVVVELRVGASGAVSDVRVARSSGFEALDEQALDMYRRAAREVAVPRALWGREFGVELRTIYRKSQASG